MSISRIDSVDMQFNVEYAPPLWRFAEKGDLKNVLDLLHSEREQVDINEVSTYPCCTALHVAAVRGYVDIVQALLNARTNSFQMRNNRELGGVVNTLSRRRSAAVNDSRTHAKVDATDIHGMTPLHYACSWLKTDVVLLLLRHGASVTRQSSPRSDPLMLTARAACSYNNTGTPDDSLRLMHILIRQGATVRHYEQFPAIQSTWDVALEGFPDTRFLELLLQNTPPSMYVQHDTHTIVHSVAMLRPRRCEDGLDIDMFKLLVRYGYDLGKQDGRGRSPLRIAAGLNKVETVKYLVSAPGVDMDTDAKDVLQTIPGLPEGVWDVINAAYRTRRCEEVEARWWGCREVMW
jgi:ankyrin repeat protein